MLSWWEVGSSLPHGAVWGSPVASRDVCRTWSASDRVQGRIVLPAAIWLRARQHEYPGESVGKILGTAGKVLVCGINGLPSRDEVFAEARSVSPREVQIGWMERPSTANPAHFMNKLRDREKVKFFQCVSGTLIRPQK